MDSLIRKDVIGGKGLSASELRAQFGDNVVTIMPVMQNIFSKSEKNDSDSAIYMRGQIWYWEDPIYGNKEGEKKIHPGEGTVRYNRYVILMQDNIEFNDTLQVVPLSSTSNSPYDVDIEVLHVMCDDTKVYAKTRLMFPIMKGQLKRYVCTLSDRIMNLVSYRVMQIIMQNTVSDFIGSQLKEFYTDIDLSLPEAEVYKRIPEVTTKTVDRPSERSLMPEGRIIIPHAQKDHSKELPKAVLSDTSNNVAESPTHKVESKKGNNTRWTTAIKKRFVKLYDEKGVEAVMVKYGITKGTAYSYIYKFREDIKSTTTKSTKATEEKEGVQVVRNGVNINACDMKHASEIPENCKNFGLYVKRYLMSRNAYLTFRSSKKKHKASKESPKFYDGVSSAVSASMMKFCFIESPTGIPKLTFDINTDTEKTLSRLNALIFLNDFGTYVNNKTPINDANELMAEYRKKYSSDFGIEREWEEDLYQALCKRLGSVNFNVKGLKDFIMKIFCVPAENE